MNDLQFPLSFLVSISTYNFQMLVVRFSAARKQFVYDYLLHLFVGMITFCFTVTLLLVA